MSDLPQSVTLDMIRGDRRAFQIVVLNTDGTTRDLTSDVGVSGHMRMTAKKKFADADEAAVFAKTDDDFAIQEDGSAIVVVDTADTSSLPGVVTTLQFDVQLSNLDGTEPVTVARGIIHVYPDVSQTSP